MALSDNQISETRTGAKTRALVWRTRRALSDQRGSQGRVLLAFAHDPQISSQTAKPVSLLQLVARGHPLGGDDVREGHCQTNQKMVQTDYCGGTRRGVLRVEMSTKTAQIAINLALSCLAQL